MFKTSNLQRLHQGNLMSDYTPSKFIYVGFETVHGGDKI